jgi:hypothetical protein
MSHPLLGKLSTLTLDELNKKYAETSKKLIQLQRYGNPDVVRQIQLILNDYKYELEERNRKIMEETEKKNPNFKDIIDIN